MAKEHAQQDLAKAEEIEKVLAVRITAIREQVLATLPSNLVEQGAKRRRAAERLGVHGSSPKNGRACFAKEQGGWT